MAEIAQRWAAQAHPRVNDFFPWEVEFVAVLESIAANLDRSHDPILGSERCSIWQGGVVEADGQPAMEVHKPGMEEATLVYVNRLLAFIFATDSSFAKLALLPKITSFHSTCGNKLCVSVAHISSEGSSSSTMDSLKEPLENRAADTALV